VKTEIRFNREWLAALGSEGFIRLAATYNVARMLERRDFRQRYDAGQPISVHEFLYPLAQAYDSVFLEADVELGGTDQLFNLNVGRDIMPAYGLPPQVVLTTPLLEGTDGVEKMSKSLGNYVGVTEPPDTMFAKLMSISDELMWRYIELLSFESPATIQQWKKDHPRDVKVRFAREIVARFHSPAAAQRAEADFSSRFREGEMPDEMPEVTVQAPDGGILIAQLLKQANLTPSTSEAQRMIEQGGVKLDGERVSDKALKIPAGRTVVAQVGKRKWAKITIK